MSLESLLECATSANLRDPFSGGSRQLILAAPAVARAARSRHLINESTDDLPRTGKQRPRDQHAWLASSTCHVGSVAGLSRPRATTTAAAKGRQREEKG